MDIYFAGTEQRMWRTLLASQDVDHVSLSYIGLRRRIRNPAAWSIAANFPEGQRVYLDSGTYTLNKEDSSTTYSEAQSLAQDYYEFVAANIDAIEFASEFDALILGRDGIQETRQRYFIDGDKLMPVWHSEWGSRALEDLAATYTRVGVLQGDTDSDITPMLRRLSGQTKLHGISMTRMEAMSEVPWSSVGSTSWLSPTQHGDTIVWTGHELKRYPKRMKDQARKRHRTWLIDQGFDIDLIEADDNAELLRLSIWSWNHFAASLDRGRGVTTSVLDPFGANAEPDPDVVGTPGGEARNAELALPAGKKLLPVLGIAIHTRQDPDGNDIEETRLTTPTSGLLACDTCFMREKCPESRPHQECVFEIPAQVRTAGQLAAVQDWLIETQTQRVAFMRLIEQVEGGYADANLSAEIGALARMIKAKQDVGKEGFSINIANVATPGGSGMIGRIFVSDVTGKMGALPAPVDSQNIVEAVIVPEE